MVGAKEGVAERLGALAPDAEVLMRYDAAIIGGGIVGCALARELSRHKLRIALLDKEAEVGFGTSKTNSGIIHGGHHAPEGTLKGRLEWEGNQLWDELSAQLKFGFKRIGELVIAAVKAREDDTKDKAKPEKPPEKPVAKTDEQILKSLERIQARVSQKQENQALKDKLSRLRDSLHDIATAKPSSTETAGQATPGTGGTDAGGTAAAGKGGGPASMLDEALKKYYIAISRKIHSNWALPDTQNWDTNLEAIAVIVIKRDGTVVETFFEKKSDNIYFDQYVEKTIQAALPMPPFPSDLREDELEIGLKFRPSGLFE